MPIFPEDILPSVPANAGSSADAASALGQPVGEMRFGDSELNGEHVVGNVGLKNLLEGKLQKDIGRAILKADDPLLGSNEGLGHLEKLIGKHTNSIQDHAADIFEKEVPTPEIESLTPDEHKNFISDLHGLTANPSNLVDKVSSGTEYLSALAPKIAASTQATAARAIGFLASKAPQPPPTPFGDVHEPSPQETAQFQRYLQIVEKPTSALRQIKDGTLTPETTETLQAVYPKLYDHMKQAVMSEIKPETPYRTKILLSQFLGQPLDSSLTPQGISQIQSNFSPAALPPSQTKRPAKAMEKIELAERTSLHPSAKDE